MLAACLLLAALGFGALATVQQHRLRQTRAAGLVEALATAEPAVVGGLVEDIQEVRRLAEPLLRQQVRTSPVSSRKHLNARLALLPSDPEQVSPLLVLLPAAGPEETALLRRALLPHRELVVPLLRELGPADLRTACLLGLYSPDEESWPTAAPRLAGQLLREPRLLVGQWAELLRPIAPHLTPALADLFHQPARSPAERALLAELLANYAGDDGSLLVDLFASADDECAAPLLGRLREQPADASRALRNYLVRSPVLSGPEEFRRKARVAAELVRQGHPAEVWPLFRHRPDPGLRTELIHRLAPAGVPAGTVIDRLFAEQDVTVMRALVLALGEFAPAAFSKTDRDRLDEWLLRTYEQHPDAGLHASIRWLVSAGWRDEKRAGQLERIERAQRGRKGPRERLWTVNGEGQTLTIVPGPVVFVMGSPRGEESDRFRGAPETRHEVRLGHSFAISSQKVTLGQFRRFREDHPHPVEYGADANGPVLAVSWYQAAEYCNWLSQREGLPPEQWCYLPDDRGSYGPGMRIAPDALSRTGYRLPAEAEWEYTCRAGAVTSRYYGSADHLLRHHAWYRHNSDAYTPGSARLKPNDLGLFDVLGTAWEWCHEPLRNEPDAAINGKTTSLCRGGSYIDLPELVRAAYRCAYPPDGKDCTLGFRIARTWKP
jgi:formylglycine-generating enzyme required for sulfatase activity